MRFMIFVLGGLMLAPLAFADVRLATKKDGTKVIYNVGAGPVKNASLDWLAKQHDRRSDYDDIIERYAEKFRVDATLVRAVIQVESNFNQNCVSNKGARGLMQLMPGTAERFGVSSIHDPEQNIKGGVQYLAYLLRLFEDDLSQALAAYNAGENAVIRYGGIPPYKETETYVKRALTVYYGRPYGGGAVSFAGGRTPGRKLRGGFGVTAAVGSTGLIPGAKYLGPF
jgi:soluble lytic murein transglycosylase-like protein